MNWRSECGVVIPCLNEAATIAELVAKVRAHFSTVLVVDDGSTDATSAQARSAGALVLRHPQPAGKGMALNAGLAWLHERQFSWALLMDGDGQHCPEDIPAFLREADSAPAAMVIGNRMGQASRMPWLRRRVNRWMSRRLSRLSGRSLPDSQCGFRLVQLASWAPLNIQAAHFEIESEMLIAFLAAGLEVRFVPIQVVYGRERSKVRPGLDSWRWCCWWWRRRRAGRSRPGLLRTGRLPGLNSVS